MPAISFDPRVENDKSGRPITYRLVPEGYRDSLIDFYLRFEPKGAYQGLPPATERVVDWVDNVVANWVSVGAFHEERLVAHAAVDRVGPGEKAEYFVFVSPDNQNLGIGTSLSRYAIDMAANGQCLLIWLVVQTSNIRAIRVYRKVGFNFNCPIGEERTMVVQLDTCGMT